MRQIRMGGHAAFVLIMLLVAVLAVSEPAAADNFDAINAYNTGVDLATGGKYPEALASFDKALAENPNFTLALTSRAGVLSLLGRDREALVDVDKALALNNASPDAWVNRGQALINLGRAEEALAAAEKAVVLGPDNPGGWIVQARAYYLLGRQADARSSYDRAFSLDPGNQVIQAERNAADFPAVPGTTRKSGPALPVVPSIAALCTAAVILFCRRSSKG